MDPAADTVSLTRTALGGTPGAMPPVEVPRDLGPVKLDRLIGRGGMGEVWLARHTILNKEVAVKFLLNMVPDERDASLEMFLEGARAASAIQHMGLNPVVHADVAQGVPYLVMEYVDGPTVADVLRNCGKLPLAAARVVIEDATEAVGVLHEHGIVHRDIKPSNILLTRDGRAVLTDFGLACPRPVLKLDSQVEGVAGTPTYMAPEMFEKTVSPRSDVYALGITALEVLTGNVPFEGTFDEIREAHLNREVPEAYIDALPAELRQVLCQAMTKKAMFRVKTASHMHRAMVEAFSTMDQGDVNRSRGQGQLAVLVARWHGVESGSASPSSSAATPQANATYYDRLGTLADSRKRAVPQIDADTSVVDRVTVSRPCVRCGSDLLDQPLTGRCPQCLLLVRLSMADSAMNAPPRSGAAGVGGSSMGGPNEGAKAAAGVQRPAGSGSSSGVTTPGKPEVKAPSTPAGAQAPASPERFSSRFVRAIRTLFGKE